MRKRCDYKQSDMTPCVITDGPICYAAGIGGEPICVGCERGPRRTGVPAPDDWDEQVRKEKGK